MYHIKEQMIFMQRTHDRDRQFATYLWALHLKQYVSLASWTACTEAPGPDFLYCCFICPAFVWLSNHNGMNWRSKYIIANTLPLLALFLSEYTQPCQWRVDKTQVNDNLAYLHIFILPNGDNEDYLTHRGRNKTATGLQTTCSNAFFNENVRISIEISLNSAPLGSTWQ